MAIYNITEWIFVSILYFLLSVFFFSVLTVVFLEIFVEKDCQTKLTDCYDNNGNLILDLKCEQKICESEDYYPYIAVFVVLISALASQILYLSAFRRIKRELENEYD